MTTLVPRRPIRLMPCRAKWASSGATPDDEGKWGHLLQLIDTKMCTEGCRRDATTPRVLQSLDKREKGERLLLSPVGQVVTDHLMYVPVHDREIKPLYATCG